MSGWLAITRNYELLRENNEDGTSSGQGRPVDAGNNNELLIIGDSEYGHSVAVDLVNGMIAIDWTNFGIQNETVEIDPKIVFAICEETNIIGEYQHRTESEVAEDGGYTIEYSPMIWRPIWFKRMISTLPGPVIVIGAQTTLPVEYGGRNIKKLVSLFPDGRLGID
jgi:hypothetical protein